jgi:hypothetical protein
MLFTITVNKEIFSIRVGLYVTPLAHPLQEECFSQIKTFSLLIKLTRWRPCGAELRD